MVKFGQKLQTNKRPEWRNHYVDYDSLKEEIKRIVKQLKSIRRNSLLNVTTNSTTTRTNELDVESNIRIRDQVRENESERNHAFIEDADRPFSVNLIKGYKTEDRNEHTGLLGDGFVHEPSSVTAKLAAMESYGSIDSIPFLKREGIPRNSSSIDDAAQGNILAQVLDTNPDEKFVSMINESVLKVETFYQTKLEEYTEKLCQLEFTISHLDASALATDPDAEEDNSVLPKGVLTAANAKRAFRDLYREAKFLQNYSILNYTAFVKIFKKHDKATGLATTKRNMELVEQSKVGFVTSPGLTTLMEHIEKIVAESYFDGNRTMARSELLLKQHHISSWEMMLLGFRAGIVLVLSIWIMWDLFVDVNSALASGELEDNSVIHLKATIRIFRGWSAFVLGMWLWTICVYVWSMDRVNFIYLFEFDPRHSILWEDLLYSSSTLTIAFVLHLLCYFKLILGAFGSNAVSYSRYLPIMMTLYMFLHFIYSFHGIGFATDTFFKLFSAPFHEVTFFLSFVADVGTSLARPFLDIAFSWCFFFSGEWRKSSGDRHDDNEICANDPVLLYYVAPVIVSLPLFIRFFQNLRRFYDTGNRWPHIANAIKYAIAQQLVVLGALYPQLSDLSSATGVVYKVLFISSLVLSTLYTYIWDVRMDWGIRACSVSNLRGFDNSVDPPQSRAMLLRYRSLYMAAIVLDLILRFSWCLTLIPISIIQEYVTFLDQVFVLATVEIVRRALWCIIRVEYEHVSNEHQYRRVGFVPALFEQDEMANRSKRGSTRRGALAEVSIFTTVALVLCVLTFISKAV